MTFKLMMATAASAALLTGCGGGGSSAGSAGTLTGTFKDATVVNLGYKCTSGTEGFTTNTGNFTCNTGDEVEFFVGAYSLGKVAMKAGVTTPYSLYPNDSTAAVNVARILQTIEDATDGTIVIPNAFAGLNAVAGTTPSDTNFDTVIGGAFSGSLVTAAAATEHMVNSLLVGSQWSVVETVSGNCPGETYPLTNAYTLEFVNFNIINNNLTMNHSTAGAFTGNYDAGTRQISYIGDIPEAGGVSSVNLTLTPNESFETFTGSSTWDFALTQGGATVCSGTTTVTATLQ
jgi:hypothetical protein